MQILIKKFILYNRKKAFWGVFLPRTTPVSVLDVDKNLLPPPPFLLRNPKGELIQKGRRKKEGGEINSLAEKEKNFLWRYHLQKGRGRGRRRGEGNLIKKDLVSRSEKERSFRGEGGKGEDSL